MLLQDHFKEVFKKASLEDNILVREIIVLKWVHRFGVDSLNDLLIHSTVLKEELCNEDHQVQIASLSEDYEEKNQYQIQFKLLDTSDNLEENMLNSNVLETFNCNEIIRKNETSANIRKEYSNPQKLPLPNIKNLRKWISNDKKAI